MSLIDRVNSLASSIGADIKSLFANKMDKTAIIPDANLTGSYTNASIKTNGVNTIYSIPSAGTPLTNSRTINSIAEFRGASNTTGCIVINTTITNSNSVMKRLHIKGFGYTTSRIINVIVDNYNSSSNLNYAVTKVSLGDTDIQVRFAFNSSGKFCVILGDVTTTWSYPHITIDAMLSHAVNDAHCSGWTVGLVTDLSGYTQLTSFIPTQPLDTVVDISKVITKTGITSGNASYKKGWRKLTATLPSSAGEVTVAHGVTTVEIVKAKVTNSDGLIVFNNDTDVANQFYVRVNRANIVLGVTANSTKVLGKAVTIYVGEEL